MPAGTTSYIIPNGHTVVLARRLSKAAVLTSACAVGYDASIQVQPNDFIWDFNFTDKIYLKISTGGNSFANLINVVSNLNTGEVDERSIIYWNGEFSIQ